VFSIACFALLGLPALSGFVPVSGLTGPSRCCPSHNPCAFGVVLTAGYLSMLRRSFFGPLNMSGWADRRDGAAGVP
jgi:NADH:ubiquinone oxidoreductase subunit 4 (subunit M)